VDLRTDGWGGSIANRVRFAVEVTRAVGDTIGADRTALRASPTASSGVDEGPVEESTELYHALLAELKDLSLAYLHVVEMPRQHKVVRKLRAACSGTFVLNPHKSDFEVHPKPHETSLDALEAGADAVAFGPAFLVNPDLVTTARPRPPSTVATIPATSTTPPSPTNPVHSRATPVHR
jgi:N-ethylmaleimide reductase